MKTGRKRRMRERKMEEERLQGIEEERREEVQVAPQKILRPIPRRGGRVWEKHSEEKEWKMEVGL